MKIDKEKIQSRIEAFASIAAGLRARRKAMRKLNADRKAGKPICGFIDSKTLRIIPFYE